MLKFLPLLFTFKDKFGARLHRMATLHIDMSTFLLIHEECTEPLAKQVLLTMSSIWIDLQSVPYT